MLKESAVFVLIIGFMISPAGLIAGFSAQSTPPQSTERFAGVRATILEVLQKSGVPSISIAAAEDGRIVWEESFGFADKEKKIEATPESMYSLASISKAFTGTGLMVLAEKKPSIWTSRSMTILARRS